MLVRFFGAAKAIAGIDQVELSVPVANLEELADVLARQCGPALAEMLPFCRFAHGTEILSQTAPIPSMGEIVVLPPVSGG